MLRVANTDGALISTKLLNSSTYQEIITLNDYVIINSQQFLLFTLASQLTDFKKIFKKVYLHFYENGCGSVIPHLTDSANTFYDILYSLQEDWRFL